MSLFHLRIKLIVIVQITYLQFLFNNSLLNLLQTDFIPTTPPTLPLSRSLMTAPLIHLMANSQSSSYLIYIISSFWHNWLLFSWLTFLFWFPGQETFMVLLLHKFISQTFFLVFPHPHDFLILGCFRLNLGPLPCLHLCHGDFKYQLFTTGAQIYVFCHELQTSVANWLQNISTWVSKSHFKFQNEVLEPQTCFSPIF